jgi:hypothetical protein
MKTSKLCALLLAGIVAPLLTASAADLFLANINVTCKESGDKIVTTKMNNASILSDYAEGGDTRDLRVAYDPEGDRLVIANAAGEVQADIFSFGFGTTVSDGQEANFVRHVFLFPEGQSDAVGTAIVTERVTYDGEVISKIASRGTLSFAQSGNETTPARVCSGTFTVGKKLVPRTP